MTGLPFAGKLSVSQRSFLSGSLWVAGGTILLGLSGHGHFDMSAYENYLAGKLEDPEFSEADMEAALERLPDAPAIA